MTKEEIIKKYDLENLDNSIILDTLTQYENNTGFISKIYYRPFDTQWTFYSEKQGFLGRPGYKIMQHFLNKENLGLCFVNLLLHDYFSHSIVCDNIMDGNFFGFRSYIAPLYLYINNEKIPNFTREFLAYKENHPILKDKDPEEILYFIYANLYDPKYREKYLEYLKTGFARINFEVDENTFNKFVQFGKELVNLHLFKENLDDDIDFIFLKKDKKTNFKIKKYQEKDRFVDDKIILNEDLAISPISIEIWQFTIGGYQVIKQWLKYRNDYECSKEELEHLLKMCKVIKQTINLQKELNDY